MGGSSPQAFGPVRDTDDALRGFPAPAGNPHGVRPRNASLRRNAGHNPQFPRKNEDPIFPWTNWRSALRTGPQGKPADGTNFEGPLRLRLDQSSDRSRKASCFGRSRHL